MMKSKNLSYKFYKEYYDGIISKTSGISDVNDEIFATEFPDIKKDYFTGIATHRFKLKVIYPGLLIGLGYPHEAKDDKGNDIKGQIISGFSLDYVTGMPVIPGSSVKGALRSAFKHEEYIRDALAEIGVSSNIDIKQLEKEIFGSDPKSDEHIMGTDVFFDAYPTSDSCNGKYSILGKENITPHGDDPFKSPIPLTFMKLVPNTVLEFSFRLRDSDLIIAQKKKELFKQILMDFGIGAKTNVGFGILSADITINKSLNAKPVQYEASNDYSTRTGKNYSSKPQNSDSAFTGFRIKERHNSRKKR